MAAQTTIDSVQKLYIAYYGRPADAAGLQFWADQAEQHGVDSIVGAFTTSPESEALYGSAPTVEARITLLYEKLFNREPEAAGMDYWKGVVADGHTDLAGLTAAIVFGAANSDSAVIRNKIAVAETFTTLVGAAAASYEGASAAAVARTIISSITDQAGSVTAAANQMGAYLNTASVASHAPDLFTTVIGSDGTVMNPNVVSTTLTADNFEAIAGAPYFVAKETAGAVAFSGSASGDIDVTVLGGVAIFTREGLTATTSVDAIAGKTIALGDGSVLDISAADADSLAGVTFSGTGSVKATEPLSLAQLGGLHFASWTGALDATVADSAANLLADTTLVKDAVHVKVTDAASLADLATIAAKTTGKVAAGSVSDSAAALVADTTWVTGSVKIAVTGFVDAADLATIAAKTTGTVSYHLADTADHIAAAIAAGGDTMFAGASDIVQTGVEAGSAVGTAGVADTFVIGGPATTTITNFEHGTDHIDLSAFVTAATVSFEPVAADGKVNIAVTDNGNDRVITVDTATDGTADLVVTLVGQAGVAIDASDFILHSA